MYMIIWLKDRIKVAESSRREKSGSRNFAIFPDVFHCRAVIPPELDDRARIEKNIGYKNNKNNKRENRGREGVSERERKRESRYRGRGYRAREEKRVKPAGCRQRHQSSGEQPAAAAAAAVARRKAKAGGRQASRPSFVPGLRPDIEMESFECE